jgi:hypothetical protein
MSRLIVTLARETARAAVVKRGRTVWEETVPREPDEPNVNLIHRLLATLPPAAKPAEAELLLEPPHVQLRTLHRLPKVPAARLGELVQHQTSRFFRQNGHPLAVDAWMPVAPDGSPVVRAAAAERRLVLDLVETLSTAGLTVKRVGVAADQPNPIDLLPQEHHAARRKNAWRSAARWLAAGALAWIGTGAIWIANLTIESHRLENILRREHAAYAAVETAEERSRAATFLIGLVDSVRAGAGWSLQRVARMTAALPPAAYLTSLAIDREGRGSVTVVAPRALETLAALERIWGAGQVRIEGPVTRLTTGATPIETFTVVFGGGGSP